MYSERLPVSAARSELRMLIDGHYMRELIIDILHARSANKCWAEPVGPRGKINNLFIK